jgi:PKHD-type hydroxylase
MILFKNYLNKEFCKGLIEYSLAQGLKESTVGEGEVNLEARRAMVHFIEWPIYNSQFIHDLYFNLENKLKEANNMMYGFDLTSLEPFQFTQYEGSDEGFYDWHVDCMNDGRPSARKLSFSVLLNDNDEFKGGEFKFRGPFEERLAQAGDLLIFPSFEEHCVEPVTEGTRYSLVGWMRGPLLR